MKRQFLFAALFTFCFVHQAIAVDATARVSKGTVEPTPTQIEARLKEFADGEKEISKRLDELDQEIKIVKVRASLLAEKKNS